MISAGLDGMLMQGEVLPATLALCLSLRRVEYVTKEAGMKAETPKAIAALFAISELILDGAGIDG